jgi:ferric-dicitrate binding protein FerR (iron transport regulator)
MDTYLQKLQAYFAGKLEEKDAQEMQVFLADHLGDPEVAALLEEQFEGCRSEVDDNTKKALSTTRNRLGLGRLPRSRSYWIAVAAAVLLLAAIPAALEVGYRLHKEPAPVAWQEIVVPTAQTRSLLLPDGTRLTLNAGSRVTWPETFSGEVREIFLDGEVEADVAKDPERPFVIHSGEVDVRVHGTRFDLKSYRDATMVEVMLMEGSVSLGIPVPEGRREVLLTPGDLAQYDRRAGEVSLGKVATEGFRTFTDGGSFSFINIPLQDIAADLERTFGTHIIVADASIASQRFLAFFTNGESLDDILKLLAANGHLRIARKDGTVYIYNRK